MSGSAFRVRVGLTRRIRDVANDLIEVATYAEGSANATSICRERVRAARGALAAIEQELSERLRAIDPPREGSVHNWPTEPPYPSREGT